MPKLPKSEMKLPSAKNNITFTLIAVFISTSAFVDYNKKFHKKKLYSTWQYTQVLKNGKTPFVIGVNDTMVLDRKGQFHYSIQSIDLHKAGDFSIIDVPLDSSPYKKALYFAYKNKSDNKQPIVYRIFNVMHLTKSLVIREGNTWFYYKKRQ